MTEQALVCDTSPLLYLGRIQQLHLLPSLFPTIYVPDPVLIELDAGRLLRPDTVDPRRLAWTCRVEVGDALLARLPETRLGAGERAVLAYALAGDHLIVGLDDRQARVAAAGLGLRVGGGAGAACRRHARRAAARQACRSACPGCPCNPRPCRGRLSAGQRPDAGRPATGWGSLRRYGKLAELDRSFDLAFWQAQSPQARFDATWELIVHAWKAKGGDVRQLRLQRSVEAFKRQER